MPGVRPPFRHAVCLTGEERSFGEVGGSIQAALLTLSGTVHVFGVEPPGNESWSIIPQLLPMAATETQARCWTEQEANLTYGWMHCDFKARKGDCRLSFLQALCDLAHCERMISAFEQRAGQSFTSILRLRADLYWETFLAVPTPLMPNTVYVPGMDSADGVNDHLAIGERWAMQRYLLRHEHIRSARAIVGRRRPHDPSDCCRVGLGSEGFLRAALIREKLTVVRLQHWMYVDRGIHPHARVHDGMPYAHTRCSSFMPEPACAHRASFATRLGTPRVHATLHHAALWLCDCYATATRLLRDCYATAMRLLCSCVQVLLAYDPQSAVRQVSPPRLRRSCAPPPHGRHGPSGPHASTLAHASHSITRMQRACTCHRCAMHIHMHMHMHMHMHARAELSGGWGI